jgi:hypothetical protein
VEAGHACAACHSLFLDIQSKLCGLVFALARTRRKIAYLSIHVTGHTEESDAEKDDTRPTQEHENP